MVTAGLDEADSGTAKRRLILELSLKARDSESVLVRLRGLRWNQIEETIEQWKELRNDPLGAVEVSQVA